MIIEGLANRVDSVPSKHLRLGWRHVVRRRDLLRERHHIGSIVPVNALALFLPLGPALVLRGLLRLNALTESLLPQILYPHYLGPEAERLVGCLVCKALEEALGVARVHPSDRVPRFLSINLEPRPLRHELLLGKPLGETSLRLQLLVGSLAVHPSISLDPRSHHVWLDMPQYCCRCC